MSPKWINRIFEVDPTFEPSMEREKFAGSNDRMKAALWTQKQEEREDSDPMAVLRMGLDAQLAAGNDDPGLFQRLRASIDRLAEERPHASQQRASG